MAPRTQSKVAPQYHGPKAQYNAVPPQYSGPAVQRPKNTVAPQNSSPTEQWHHRTVTPQYSTVQCPHSTVATRTPTSVAQQCSELAPHIDPGPKLWGPHNDPPRTTSSHDNGKKLYYRVLVKLTNFSPISFTEQLHFQTVRARELKF